MSSYLPLTDEQWSHLSSFFPAPVKRGRGKPHTPWRSVLNSILFVLVTGAKWGALPKSPEFASKSAAHRWFILWDENGMLDQILAKLSGLAESSAQFTFPARRQKLARPLDVAIAPAIAAI